MWPLVICLQKGYPHGIPTPLCRRYPTYYLITSSSPWVYDAVSKRVRNEGLRPLNYFLGISVSHRKVSLFLSLQKYVNKILERAGMSSCHPSSTPVDNKTKLNNNDGTPLPDNGVQYHQLVGALQYLTFTLTDISYAIQQICIHMHAPRTSHFNSLKDICGTLKLRSLMGYYSQNHPPRNF